MKITRTLSLLAVVAVLAVTACKKDNPSPSDPNNPGGGNTNPPAPTKTSILTEKQWKVRSTLMIEDGQTDTASINIVGATNWRFTFRADRTGSAVGTFLGTSSDPNPEFTWSFNADSTAVNLTAANGRAAIYDFRDSLLTRTVEGLTLQLLNQQGQPVGTITGTLLESFDKVN